MEARCIYVIRNTYVQTHVYLTTINKSRGHKSEREKGRVCREEREEKMM